MAHVSVLLKESIEFLKPDIGKAFIDATAGSGGHTKEILEKMPDSAILVAIDRDENAVAELREKFLKDERLKTAVGNFRNLKNIAGKFAKTYDGILFDLGMRSEQLENSGRGFSFQKDEPLLMTYDAKPDSQQINAALIINTWPEDKLIEIFKNYGEERNARTIAKEIIKERAKDRIFSSKRLSEIILNAVGGRGGKINPATKVFQALRIAVNDELGALEEGLENAWKILNQRGRIVVISFHSLEDRIIKNFFKSKKTEGKADILTKKPLRPSKDEIKQNFRSRSAKLRAAVKI